MQAFQLPVLFHQKNQYGLIRLPNMQSGPLSHKAFRNIPVLHIDQSMQFQQGKFSSRYKALILWFQSLFQTQQRKKALLQFLHHLLCMHKSHQFHNHAAGFLPKLL